MQINPLTNRNFSDLSSKNNNKENSKNTNSNCIASKDKNSFSMLPVYNIDSAFNYNLPVTYQKTGVIPIPGLKQGASVFKLSNGQTVIIAPKKGKFYIQTKFNTGSNNETKEQKGISHFIEHNLSAGSRDLKPGEYRKKINLMGGDYNAATGRSLTEYFQSVYLFEDDTLEECIKLNADKTQFPLFDKQYIENEKGVVKSEINSNTDDIYENAASICYRNLYNIPYDFDDILGSKENIDNFRQEDLKDYYKTYYTPDNTVTIIIGDVDIDETMNLVSKYFNKKPDYSNISKRTLPVLTPVETPKRQDFVSKTSKKSIIQINFALKDNLSMEDMERIFAMIDITQDEKSSLSKKFEEMENKTEVDFDFNVVCVNENKKQNANMLSISVTCDEDKTEDAIQAVYDELTNIMNGISIKANEVEIYKNKRLKAIDNPDCDNDDICYYIEEALLYNDCQCIQNKKNAVNNIDVRNIADTLRRNIDFNKASIVVFHAKDTKEESIKQNYANTLNLNTQKPAAEVNNQISFTSKKQIEQILLDDINSVQTHYLSNNIKINTINSQKKHNTLRLELFGDSFLKIPPEQLIFELVALSLLLEGGSQYISEEALNDYKDKNNIILYSDVDETGVSIQADCEEHQLKEVLDLMKQIIYYPRFLNEDEFNKIKSSYKQILTKSSDADEKTLDDKINDYLYPNSAVSNEEIIKILDGITIDDIQKLYYDLLNNCSVEFSVSADFNRNPALISLFDYEMANFKPPQTNSPFFKFFDKTKDYYSKTYTPNTKEAVITNPKETKKAYIEMIYNYNKLSNVEDIAKANILLNILNDRIFKDLRSNQGLVYDAGAKFGSMRNIGEIILYTDITTDDFNDTNNSSKNIDKVLDTFKKQTGMLKTSPVTQEELTAAKNTIKTSVLDDLEDSGISHAFDSYSYLGKMHDLEYIKAIDKITPEDIQAAAKFLLKNPPVIGIEASQKTIDEFNKTAK